MNKEAVKQLQTTHTRGENHLLFLQYGFQSNKNGSLRKSHLRFATVS